MTGVSRPSQSQQWPIRRSPAQAQPPGPAPAQAPTRPRTRYPLIILLTLALLHGLQAALVMPPWGLIDEAQHFDYILALAQGRWPVTGQSLLAPAIADSLFATNHWFHFLWSTPASHSVSDMGLVAYSYEAYQPPLFYLLLAPLQAVLPGGVLDQLFVLRLVVVLLSLLTVCFVFQTTLLLGDSMRLATLAALVLIFLPERTLTVSRLNNDVLVEVLGAALCLALVSGLRRGFSTRRAWVIAALLAAGIWTKLSMTFWLLPLAGLVVLHRRRDVRRLWIAIGGGAAAALALAVRNLLIYQDVTGYSAFMRLHDIVEPALTPANLLLAARDQFRHFWLIWWKGADVGSSPVVELLYLLLAALTVLSLAKVGQLLWRARRERSPAGDPAALALLLSAVAVFAAAALYSYFRGIVPVVQGRFLAPATAAGVVVFAWGLWQWRRRAWLLGAAILLLLVGDTLLLWANLLPYHYFWSSALLQPELAVAPLPAKLRLAWAGLMSDKPPWVALLMPAVIAAYWVAVPIAFFLLFGGQQAVARWRRSAAPAAAQAQLSPRARRQRRLALGGVFAALALLYLAIVWLRPTGVFWSLDEGGKLLYMQNVLRTGDAAGPLLYPGRALDPTLAYLPLFYWAQQGGQVYSWWPPAFPLLTLPFYQMLGWLGLYVLPALGGAASALLAGLIAEQLAPAEESAWRLRGRALPTWTPAAVTALIVGLATPVLFYATMFWEHTPSVALALLALWLAMRSAQEQRLWPATVMAAVAGVAASLGGLLRTEQMFAALGAAVVLLAWRTRAGLAMLAAFALTTLGWLAFNLALMGAPFSRQWGVNNSEMTSVLLPGLREAGLLYVPYLLFNAPKITAYDLGAPLLALGVLLTLAAVALPLILPFLPRLRVLLGGLLIACYAALAAIALWVLVQPSGYRTVHGVLVIAPHIIASPWLWVGLRRAGARRWPVAMVTLAVLLVTGAYVARSWLAAGGQQWGSRYLLVLYPLLTAGAVAGLAPVLGAGGLPRSVRNALALAFALLVAVGAGFEARGQQAVWTTVQNYRLTQQALQQVDGTPKLTDCIWLPMVIPELYWRGDIYARHTGDQTFADWKAAIARLGAGDGKFLTMDMCLSEPLSTIAPLRSRNPSGITIGDVEREP